LSGYLLSAENTGCTRIDRLLEKNLPASLRLVEIVLFNLGTGCLILVLVHREGGYFFVSSRQRPAASLPECLILWQLFEE